jgi:predicted MFS family arabinose efflux permease
MKPYSAQNRKMYIYLVVMASVCAFSFQGWRAMITNFSVETVGIDGQQMGMIQGIREVPGFLSFCVIYVLLLIKEYRLGALSVALTGLGVCMVGILPSYYGLIFTTLIMSFGFHYYETVNQSLTVQHFSITQVPLVLGRVRSISAIANVAAVVVVFGLTYVMDYDWVFLIIGGGALLVGLKYMAEDPTPQKAEPQKNTILLRKRYWLFYALTFMAGARRQIFVAFALFLMVDKFEFSVQEMSLLFLFNNIVRWIISPWIGWAVNRFGERIMLSVEYLGLIAIFMAYAYTDSKLMVTAIYVVDHILFGFSLAITSYFRKIADPSEVAPSMAMGFTINHIVAVLIPILGGFLWLVDYRLCFVAGSGFALISLVLAQLINLKSMATAQ